MARSSGADLDDAPVDAQLGQRARQRIARRQGESPGRRHAESELGDGGQALAAADLFEMVDDDEHRPTDVAEGGDETWHGGDPAAGRTRGLLGCRPSAGSIGSSASRMSAPESDGVVVGAFARDPGDLQALAFGPLPQECGLAVARRRDNTHDRFIGLHQPVDER